EAAPPRPGQPEPVSPWIAVTPDYFPLMGLRLVDGRLLDARDAERPNLESIVVDTAWARRFFPNRSAVGQRLQEGGCSTCPLVAVVGVVTDVRYIGVDKPDEGTVYAPMPPQLRSRFALVRTAGDPAAALAPMRQIVHELDASLPLSRAAAMDELIADSLQ